MKNTNKKRGSKKRKSTRSHQAATIVSPPISRTNRVEDTSTSTPQLDVDRICTSATQLIATSTSEEATLYEEKSGTRAERKAEEDQEETKKPTTLPNGWTFWCHLSDSNEGDLAKERGVYGSHNGETDELKFGYIYSDNNTVTNFGHRMNVLYQTSSSEGICYKLLSTEYNLTEEGVRELENFGKFALFLEHREEDSDRSCFSGKAELYVGVPRKTSDAVLDTLRRFATLNVAVEYVTSCGRYTISSSNYENHHMYPEYLYKAALGARQKHTNDLCMFKRGYEGWMDTKERYVHWKHYTGSFIASCPCMEGGGVYGIENINVTCYASALLIVLIWQPKVLISPLLQMLDMSLIDFLPCIKAFLDLRTACGGPKDPRELLSNFFTNQDNQLIGGEEQQQQASRFVRFAPEEQQCVCEFMQFFVEKVDAELATASANHRFRDSFCLRTLERRCCGGQSQYSFPLIVPIRNVGEGQVLEVEGCITEYLRDELWDESCECGKESVIISKRIERW